ncbi:putative lysosomal Pro-Xaa carboxypeptidase [Helianthus annuus]|uniref:Lysosomal Pro-Xaa carboxypeptidase n=1 Tax=Helianthus annuus TaxID=4232 RepID=A0A251VRY7_HELAN|nr:lysosomal Pro-X carboxypeptidase [Helianthus annuus]KAF5822721.1 putative lysosomal Pro-Xaa carboxypeptidase [Helianthus annuus]KAJ0627522.1 putative lysosomal Pro-Xaa carboxypeptidase [Helianthus annuus]KAJ0783827.1 putative lysosomal Pro-Xaa carboxypeptidase [Helianthus annuus]KAJ0948725.1 putative lysosomal Pro-Xaa carboxypeptidase [Helianthus annuus]KAJ0957597.1 putative lysosomal Pro-Xaa carboxypeptidase [Helianthus annuus]
MAQFHYVFLFKLSLIIMILLRTSVNGKRFGTTKLGSKFTFVPTNFDVENAKNKEYEVYNYTQTLDHFNFKSESYTTFQQRYVLNRKYWGGTAKSFPIFVYTGAESSIMGDVEYSGFEMTLASQFKGLLVYIEHRYYGTSMPFGSYEEAYKNANTLGFFTSEQALADYAQITLHVKSNLSAEDCPVIAIGGSYGGMLASWFRLKYPHIVYGALASSAPILYFLGLTPENGYAVVVSKDFNSTSTSCYNTIRESWFEIDRVAAQSNGLSTLSQTFNTCLPLNTSQDLKDNLESWYKFVAQYDNPRANYLPTFCNATNRAGANTYVLDKIMAGFSALLGKECIYISDLGLQKYHGWHWQKCTEMVMPMGNGENDTVFQADPFDLAEYTKECKQVFGVTPRPYWIPIQFGGYGIKTVLENFASNIIFSNGLRDPYSSGGVMQNISDSVVAIYTEEGHHCLDLQTPNDTDPDWLKAQRNAEINMIEGWLSEYKIPNAN